MKIAVTGKGGAGKTTVVCLLAMYVARRARKVIVVDSDPDSDVALSLGLSRETAERLTPLAEMKELIEERTGAQPGSFGGVMKLNPEVRDLVERLAINHNGLALLKLGALKQGGDGCYCAENVLLCRLVRHLVLEADEHVILDMEAGIEHLTRGTARGVDSMLVVVDANRTSLKTAQHVKRLADDLGVPRVLAVANRVRSAQERRFIAERIKPIPVATWLPFSLALSTRDLVDTALADLDDSEWATGVATLAAQLIGEGELQ